ncbi:MAG TPA: lmo0937 family membrane protein [Candidatus Saccharimonadia bacterium]|nr:lmo0937 family membrane protein [Candidatus Saccharimonadia bacterium]
MIYTIIVVLVILWLLGLIGHIGGSLIHILLVVALVVFIYNLITGRRTGV